jgi:AraC family transcriptional regulator, transcriptional activator of the genes for pyochelin and ferripyochelin receptors
MTEQASATSLGCGDRKDFSSRFGDMFGPSKRDAGATSLIADGPGLSGKFELYPVRPGLRIFAVSLDASRDVELNVEPTNPGVIISLVLDGRSACITHRPGGRNDVWEFLPGRNVVAACQPEPWRWKITGGESHRLVELHISSGRALQLLSEYQESARGALHPVLSQPISDQRLIEDGLIPELRIIAQQVLSCRLQGPAKRLFMESKALEILALQLDALSCNNPSVPALRNKAERDRLEEARSIIQQEFADPPSLLALARRVGLNEFKLKRGFRHMYRTTVFGYVRELRMDNARTLLETGELNITEVACAVGYTCFGHFSEAFRKRFGMVPREFRKGLRR